MKTSQIAFIGAGNMARAIIGGLIADGVNPNNITASGPRAESLKEVTDHYGIEVSTDNVAIAARADILVLAVKPQMLKKVAQDLADAVAHKPLIISVAAGIGIKSIERWLGAQHAIVRCMPNTPSQLRHGASGLFANERVSPEQKLQASSLLGAVGVVQWLNDESLINAVTAVSGSGPAYFFLVMESMIAAGVALGLTRECATELTLQTALGAAILAKQSHVDVAELRRCVTSPNGTTEQAIKSFEADDVRGVFYRAMQACANRGVELSEMLGQ
jgi:pyrroline-5-carboxylate reductase